ncbi:hypothetical protein J3R82DRAFT_6789 [Butyriboletus roseoflavus]|nr:hypothetical protein J3R82DRAFT_6789 [Butyriboletus roseoflavus]
MDLSEMTWRILKMFEDQDNWTHDMLAWWNSQAFLKGNSQILHEDSDSEDNVAVIHAQRGKAKAPMMLECHAAEVIEFATPPPIEHEIMAGSTLTSSISTTSISGTFSNVPDAQDSNLSSCTSDNEQDESLLPKANHIVQPMKMVSTGTQVNTAQLAATPAITEDPQINDVTITGCSGHGNTKKKAPAPSCAKNPRHHTTKKANGF